jgi:outer membrane protein assembly factor BamE (lipoprotein component of BamABCDE complex)
MKPASAPYKITLFIAFCTALMILSCCAKKIESRGYTIEQAEFDKIQVNKSRKEDVTTILGSPSARSTYGKETWYYVAAKTKTVAFLPPKMTEQHVIAISFSSNDTVDTINHYSLSDAKNIAYEPDVTKTEGSKAGVIQQLLGNVGRFNPAGTDRSNHSNN